MQKRYPFEVQLTRLCLATSVPLLILLIWVMVYASIDIALILLTGFIGGIAIMYSYYQIKHKSDYQFRSISNILGAMSQGEYSLRARSDKKESALDELVNAINGLAERLSEQRRVSAESQRLLHTVIEHIDVAIMALDDTNQVSFYNPAANRLLLLDDHEGSDRLLSQLSFHQTFSPGTHQVIDLMLGQQQGRFNVHVEAFRDAGKQHKLLFITDVRTLLRSEERKAWKSLVRVISHEINNSLSPIASVSQTLKRQVSKENSDSELFQDLATGLTLISERTRGLSEFIDSYKQLAKLPEPDKQPTHLLPLIKKTCHLLDADRIRIDSDGDVSILVDPVQIEQVLINLCKNALEAMQNTSPDGEVLVSWTLEQTQLTISVKDLGVGISNLENLFVPFYSTKKQGSGIGLVLCRQIVEAHGGRLNLDNNPDGPGCCAKVELPIAI